MARRLSPKQLQVFKEMIRRKRVLDIGDPKSHFLASEFARYATHWTVVGRPPPADLPGELPPHVAVVEDPFDDWTEKPHRSSFDVVVLAAPSPEWIHDLRCLEWATHEHQLVFFGHPTDDTKFGSPGFWQMVQHMEIQQDERDLWSRMIVMEKRVLPEPDTLHAARPHAHTRTFPQKGQRFRIAASVRWPGKKTGDRPPVVEIASHWTGNSGPVKLLNRGDLIHLQRSELAAPL